MELVSPAGNLEKLTYAYLYGADAVYIGVKEFSLRRKADNFHENEWKEIRRIKGSRKLYCALNISFHNRDLSRLEKEMEYISQYPFDAFIISDLGLLPLLRRWFPRTPLHLSTQANCTNWRAAEVYRDLGFQRIILGREVSLDEVAEVKTRIPDLELEIFVHGAMCLAYSGRCFLSAWMADRSANQGNCAHPCRWNYRVLEEAERPGEYYPILESEGFTTILSSKDLCMIDHLARIRETGVDALKIEGRMKSLYYTAIVTRAYRKHLDALKGVPVPDLELYRQDVFRVSHREYSTGFYFGKSDVEKPAESLYREHHVFLGTIGEPRSNGTYAIDLRNRIEADQPIEYIGPSVPLLRDEAFTLWDSEGNPLPAASHGQTVYLKPGIPVEPGYIIRKTG
ncbi:MAG: peptidase U32 family protein [Spirochaetales bacterium]